MESIRAKVRSLLIRLSIIVRPDLLAQTVPEHPAPESMEPGIIYVVAGKGYRKWAFLRCPADNDEIIQLSLMTSRRPRWRVNVDLLGRPTIHPSVRQLDGSYAHFWVRRGRIEWCADSGQRRALDPNFDAHHDARPMVATICSSASVTPKSGLLR